MPSWPNRLLPPRPPPGTSSSNPASSTSPSPSPGHSRMPSRITESDILENAYGIPTLPPSPRAALKTRGRGGGRRGVPSRSGDQIGSQNHTRAVSLGHSLPGLFARGRKGGAGADRSGDGEDSGPMPHQRQREKELSSLGLEAGLKKHGLNSKGKGADGNTGNSSKEMVTGKCMTCDSLVRWPRELSVFRCTVCLTINDLHPVSLEVQRENGARVVKTGKEGGKGGAGPSQLSIGRTRELIEKCVVDYLLQRLTHQGGDVKGKRDAVGRKNTQESGRDALSLSTKDHSVLPLAMTAMGLNETEHHRGRENSHGQDSIENSEDQIHAAMSKDTHARQGRVETPQSIFQPLEDYIISSFGTLECINNSFKTSRPSTTLKTARTDKGKRKSPFPDGKQGQSGETLLELDAKTLLLGDITENSSWWRGDGMTNSSSPERSRTIHGGETSNDNLVTLKSPMIDWTDVNEWYYLVLNAGRSWQQKLNEIVALEPHMRRPPLSDKEMDEIEAQMIEAQFRAQRVLLKATESLLKRPGRLLQEPGDLRFLLIILANPLLYPTHSNSRPTRLRSASTEKKIFQERSTRTPKDETASPGPAQAPSAGRGSSGRHSGIIKRILGLLSNLPNECHHHLVSWFARYSDGQFQRTTDLIGSFVTYRLTRQNGAKREVDQDPTAGLVPSVSSSGRNTSAALHAAIGSSGQSKKNDSMPQAVIYNDDWQIKAAARVMALFFSANNSGLSRKANAKALVTPENGQSAGLAARERAYKHGQILPTSDFYNTLLDYSDLIADFEAWESKRGKFTFCQYPFFLSIWAKIQIMEHDARRQMEVKAREAFFDSIMTHKNVNQYLVLKIRRDCLVEDSLKGVSEVVGSGNEEIKKGLRIEFNGEEGIDAGGLRKEWFLLLVRDVFNPEHGMFTYDEESHFCYFNPYSFETTDQFFLVGVVLGLAIYNSTILDVALPPFAFRKLLAAGPASAPGASSHAKPIMTYTLEDLAEYRPALATGLRQLLEFDGDVESTFCRDFVADIERYGQTMQVPLCPDGEKIPVTNTNRREFVDLYVRYLLEVQVVRQFEPFKRGFFTVCGGNALSLFRPEEIELLIRGSDEPLDIASLRAVAVCENWGVPNAADSEPVVQWFWNSFETASPKDQRKLLSFITGSDRIPAMGATNLVIKLSCLGDDCKRFPVARTCFNMLSLYRYASRAKLERMLWRAVNESEGFGLK